jgi:hypothetical protein
MCADKPKPWRSLFRVTFGWLGLRINLQQSSCAPNGKVRRSRTARGVVSGSDGYYQTAPGVREARTAATSPATLCALPNRALHPDCARTHHRHGRDCVARPWAPKRARRHQPLPHPLGVTVRDIGWWLSYIRRFILHRPFQESASTRPVGRVCSPQRPRTNAAVPITRFGSRVRDPRWPCPVLRENADNPNCRARPALRTAAR